MLSNRETTIVLVEDDDGHARLIEKNLRRAHIANPIVRLCDGHEAVDYLFSDEYDGRPREEESPLVLLDLNMPGMDGHGVLERIKSDERTRRIPVVVLTSTDDQREVARCYDQGCSVYLTKPVEYQDFCEAVRKLGLFLSVVTLPQAA